MMITFPYYSLLLAFHMLSISKMSSFISLSASICTLVSPLQKPEHCYVVPPALVVIYPSFGVVYSFRICPAPYCRGACKTLWQSYDPGGKGLSELLLLLHKKHFQYFRHTYICLVPSSSRSMSVTPVRSARAFAAGVKQLLVMTTH